MSPASCHRPQPSFSGKQWNLCFRILLTSLDYSKKTTVLVRCVWSGGQMKAVVFSCAHFWCFMYLTLKVTLFLSGFICCAFFCFKENHVIKKIFLFKRGKIIGLWLLTEKAQSCMWFERNKMITNLLCKCQGEIMGMCSWQHLIL